jgi:hypothetical protein
VSLSFFRKAPNFASIHELGQPAGYVVLYLNISGPKLVYKCCLELPVFWIMEMITAGYENKAKRACRRTVWADGEVHVVEGYSSWYLNLQQNLGEDTS